MRKVALVFIIAVILPSLVLAWLAVGSLRDQEVVLERQQTLLYQAAADAIASRIRTEVDNLRSEFESEVAAMLRGADAASVAGRFDQGLRARWPMAEIGFSVALDGDLLAPSMFEGPDARQFRLENTRFLCSRESFDVYWNGPKGSISLTQLDQKQAAAGPAPSDPAAKAKAVRTVSPTKEPAPDAAASKLAPESAAFRQIASQGESGTVARFLQDELNLLFWYRPPLDRPLVFGAKISLGRLVDKVRDALVLDPPLKNEIGVALLNAAGQPMAVSPGGFLPSAKSAKLVFRGDRNTFASVPTIELSLPSTPPTRPESTKAAQAGPSYGRSTASLGATSSRPLTLVNGDWQRPYVATEIGEILPHWEVAAYVVDLDKLGRSAALTRLTVGLLIALLVLAIAVGSWLIVADLKRQLALARQKTDFVSNVSHELKTPLTSIRMFSEMLADGRVQEEDKRRQFLNIITAEASRLTRLINNVLDFARLERGEKQYQLAPLNLAALAHETVDLYRPHLETAGFQFTAPEPGVGRGTEVVVRGDRDALAQVMVNLLSNAEKYSGDRREIAVSLHVDPEGRHVEWSVLDRGRGVPPGCEEKIFEQFYRAHDSLADGVQGSGLGLTLARQIAEAHGGTVTYQPRDGGGSRFTLRLPLNA